MIGSIGRRYITNSTVKLNQMQNGRLTWNEYFQRRIGRNRSRPLVGVPFFGLGVAAVVGFVPFNPFNPIMGVDPSMMVGIGAVGAGLVSYQIGAGLGQLGWRIVNRKVVGNIDKMDKVFYAKVKRYRAERGQSPYLNTMSGTNNAIKSVISKADKKTAAMAANRQDFYGEKIKSITEYRHWLRKQINLTREQFGKDSSRLKLLNQ